MALTWLEQQPSLCHDLAHLESPAGARLPEELLELRDFAVKAWYAPEATPLPDNGSATI
ncbi:MAG: hypothetical protein VKI42_08460 [Synechococcaceae cyanobacterium]|nr:hypothetical protein [Synechococcaceae cyanobacterium]